MATVRRLVSVVGSTYYPGADVQWARMRPGQQLRAEREPNNEHDANAVSVHIFNQQLGHFPRGFATEVAPLMDAGKALKVWKSKDPRFGGSCVTVVEWETE